MRSTLLAVWTTAIADEFRVLLSALLTGKNHNVRQKYLCAQGNSWGVWGCLTVSIGWPRYSRMVNSNPLYSV